MSTRQSSDVTAWSESDSEHFIDFGRYFVPERELQMATLCRLVPAPVRPGPFLIVELCSGEGLLTRALLEAFPAASLLALDGSSRMLEATRKSAGGCADRLQFAVFDIASRDWRRFDRPPQAVVSSLAVHHLDGAQKRQLFADMAETLAPGGALIIADIVAPRGELAWRAAGECWDDEVRRRARELDGNLAAFDRFEADGWNLFKDPDPDPLDKPSPLYDQLRWLEAAGLTAVDVYWMKAGHAVFGGRKPGGDV